MGRSVGKFFSNSQRLFCLRTQQASRSRRIQPHERCLLRVWILLIPRHLQQRLRRSMGLAIKRVLHVKLSPSRHEISRGQSQRWLHIRFISTFCCQHLHHLFRHSTRLFVHLCTTGFLGQVQFFIHDWILSDFLWQMSNYFNFGGDQLLIMKLK